MLSIRQLLAICAISLFATASAGAQVLYGSLTGVVTDSRRRCRSECNCQGYERGNRPGEFGVDQRCRRLYVVQSCSRHL